MAHDLFFRNSKRDWTRSSTAPSVGNDDPAPLTKAKKITMGAMAVATGIGLLFITSPWWRSMPAPARTTNRPLGPHAYHFTRSPSGRIISRPI